MLDKNFVNYALTSEDQIQERREWSISVVMNQTCHITELKLAQL